jgi:hypothetical protein
VLAKSFSSAGQQSSRTTAIADFGRFVSASGPTASLGRGGIRDSAATGRGVLASPSGVEGVSLSLRRGTG